MDNTWNKLYDAAKQVLNPREISKMIEAGGVQGKYMLECVSILHVHWVYVPSAMRSST
jgi:hypothetical protein